MAEWVLFIVTSCGPGCIEVTAELAESKLACLASVELGPVTYVICEEGKDG